MCLSQVRKRASGGLDGASAGLPRRGRTDHYNLSADEGAHICGGGKVLCLRGERLHVSSGDSTDALLDLWNERRSEAQFVNPKADE